MRRCVVVLQDRDGDFDDPFGLVRLTPLVRLVGKWRRSGNSREMVEAVVGKCSVTDVVKKNPCWTGKFNVVILPSVSNV